MKFYYYLNELGGPPLSNNSGDLIKSIKRDCKPYLNIMKNVKSGNWFTRYYRKYEINNFMMKVPRADRNPTDTPIEIHNIFNNMLYEKFGWKPRSEGVFCWPHIKATETQQHFFYPIGKFQYVWSPKIQDFFNYYKQIEKEFDYNLSYEEFIPYIEKAVKTYTDKNLLYSFKPFRNMLQTYSLNEQNFKNEVMFKCEKYYLVNSKNYGILYNEGLIS